MDAQLVPVLIVFGAGIFVGLSWACLYWATLLILRAYRRPKRPPAYIYKRPGA